MIDQNTIDRLCSIAREENVSTELVRREEYSRDASPFPPVLPGAIVTPTSTEVLSKIVEICNETKTPVLPFGSGYSFTGLSNRRGGSTIVVDMKKMNKIIQIDETNGTVTSESGAIVGNLSDEVRRRGYYVNTVAIPYYNDTLGGMISGVIGGGYPLYSSSVGLDNKDILGLKVVLPNGRIVETNGRGVNVSSKIPYPFIRETGSPDMTGVFIGDGGIFGIKTEATLAMHLIPEHWRAGAWLFSNFEDAFGAMVEACASSGNLCDYLTILSPEITGIYDSNGPNAKNWGMVYYFQGHNRIEVDARTEGLESNFQKRSARRGTEALLEFSRGMRTGEAYSRRSGYSETLTKRASCALFASSNIFSSVFHELYSDLRSRVERYNSDQRKKLTASCVIHSVLRNCIWTNIILNYNSEEDSSIAYEIIKDVHIFAAKTGATFESHGGYAADLMGANWSRDFRDMMLTLKGALDPNNILNPGLWFSDT